jgi:hypothetical protein
LAFHGSVVANLHGIHSSIIKFFAWILPDRVKDVLLTASFVDDK